MLAEPFLDNWGHIDYRTFASISIIGTVYRQTELRCPRGSLATFVAVNPAFLTYGDDLDFRHAGSGDGGPKRPGACYTQT